MLSSIYDSTVLQLSKERRSDGGRDHKKRGSAAPERLCLKEPLALSTRDTCSGLPHVEAERGERGHERPPKATCTSPPPMVRTDFCSQLTMNRSGQVAPAEDSLLDRLNSVLPDADLFVGRESVFEEVERPSGFQDTS